MTLPVRLCCAVCGETLVREPALSAPDVIHLICPEHGDRAYEWPLRVQTDADESE